MGSSDGRREEGSGGGDGKMGGKGKECCVVYESLIYKIFSFLIFFSVYCKIFEFM